MASVSRRPFTSTRAPLALLPLPGETSPREPTRPRVLFYSHDSYGLGHIRRTLSLCETVRDRYPEASLLVLTGSSVVADLPRAEGVDWIKLPSVTKVNDGEYRSRYLPIGFDAVRAVRGNIIRSTIEAYQPSLVFVDNVPVGLKGELVPALRSLRRRNPGAHVVLTLRDILDAPDRIRRRWQQEETSAVIDELYDSIVVYGTPRIFDIEREYDLPASVAAKVHYAGYIRREPRGAVGSTRTRLLNGAERLVLVTVGGGADGQQLVDAYLDGLERNGATLGGRTHHLIVCGPDMDQAIRHTISLRGAARPDITVIDFCPDLVTTMAAADVVVAMGGYNTICEILSLGKRAVILPRRHPRLEQWIRCTRMAALGLLRVVDPADDPSTHLIRQVRLALDAPAPDTSQLDFGGLTTLDRLLPSFLNVPHV